MKYLISLLALTAFPVHASETRSLNAHEHGSGTLRIAFEDSKVIMQLESPGADIVGFEHAPGSQTEKTAVADAIAKLSDAESLFSFPQAAGCSLSEATAELEGQDSLDDHNTSEHDHEHNETQHAEHENGLEDNGRASESSHSEFHAEYHLICSAPGKVDSIQFGYFAEFPNAVELDVEVLSPSGAKAFEVSRNKPVLNLPALY